MASEIYKFLATLPDIQAELAALPATERHEPIGQIIILLTRDLAGSDRDAIQVLLKSALVLFFLSEKRADRAGFQRLVDAGFLAINDVKKEN
jgi:hypothetical protein